MIIARVETRNFSFMAAGRDQAEAVAALRAGWEEHVGQYGADPTMMDDLIDQGEVDFHPIEPGACLRDGEPLIPPKEPT